MGKIVRTILIILLLSEFSYAYCENGPYWIDWKKGEIVVSGISDVAQRETGNPIEWQYSAAVQAKRSLLENFVASLGTLRVDAYNSAIDILMKEPSRNEAVQGYIRSFEDFQVVYGTESVTIIKHVPLFGKEALLPLIVEAGLDPGHFPSYDELVFSTEFSGVVIDGRGLGRIPAVNPKIYDEDHNLVYSADLLEKSRFERWGACQYTDDPYYKGYAERVGENPLRLVAISNPKLIETDLCISNEDAMVLLQDEETKARLQEGRVIILIDSL
jgi:hypothetical protein